MKNEFPQLEVGHQLIDSAAMLMVKDPRALNGIVVTSNLFGDIISDEASVIPGSLGLLPSASLSGVPDGKSKVNGIYEPIHGTSVLGIQDDLRSCSLTHDRQVPHQISREKGSSTPWLRYCQRLCCYNTL